MTPAGTYGRHQLAALSSEQRAAVLTWPVDYRASLAELADSYRLSGYERPEAERRAFLVLADDARRLGGIDAVTNARETRLQALLAGVSS